MTASIASSRCDGSQVVGVVGDLHEDRRGTHQRHNFGRGRKGEGRNEHRVTGADFVGKQWDQQRVGPIGTSDGVFDADIVGNALLELRHFRTENVSALVQHLGHGPFKTGSDPRPLSGKINELHACFHPPAAQALTALV